jgi:hypothetical protein
LAIAKLEGFAQRRKGKEGGKIAVAAQPLYRLKVASLARFAQINSPLANATP